LQPLHRLPLDLAELQASPIRTQGEEGHVPCGAAIGSAGEGAEEIEGGAREFTVGSNRTEEDRKE